MLLKAENQPRDRGVKAGFPKPLVAHLAAVAQNCKNGVFTSLTGVVE